MPKLWDNTWKESRHNRVMTLAPRWQDCPVNTYYTINRILLLCIGLWPYQTSTFKYIAIASTTITLVLSIVFQLMSFVTTEYVDILLHVLAYTVPWLAITLKYGILCLNIKQMRNIMERICCDWNELHNVQEVEIIKKYSALGKFITLITTLFIYVSISCFILVPFLSNFLLDIISTKNESRSRQFPILIECFVDQQKYFFLLLCVECFAFLYGLTTVAATETLHMSYTHHACGLFEIASYRIEQALLKNMIQDTTPFTKGDSVICQRIINGFNMYKKAIEFVNVTFIEMLRRSYTWAYTFLLPLGVLSLSINLYYVSQLLLSKEYNEVIISFLFILGHFWYMLFCNYLGQQVIDYSSDIFHRIYNVQWYVAPLRAQKLLLLVMLRSMKHSTIVIGGLFIVSLKGFATLASTSISYFAVIFSLF